MQNSYKNKTANVNIRHNVASFFLKCNRIGTNSSHMIQQMPSHKKKENLQKNRGVGEGRGYIIWECLDILDFVNMPADMY